MRKSSSNNSAFNATRLLIPILFISLIIIHGCNSTPVESNLIGKQILDIITSDTDSVQQSNESDLYNCSYLNEQPPSDVPIVFAEGLVSTNVDESSFEINKQGDMMIFTRNGDIQMMINNNGEWSSVKRASFSSDDVDGECCFTPDGEKIYFNSRRAFPHSHPSTSLWYSEKINSIWAKAVPVIAENIKGRLHAVSVSGSGDIYYSGIKLAYKRDDVYYAENELRPSISGSHPFIAPDESYMILCKRAPGRYDNDLYISFRKTNSWTKPLQLNEKINTTSMESNPFVTPDGKYLFFIRNYDVYWVEADFLEHLQVRINTDLE